MREPLLSRPALSCVRRWIARQDVRYSVVEVFELFCLYFAIDSFEPCPQAWLRRSSHLRLLEFGNASLRWLHNRHWLHALRSQPPPLQFDETSNELDVAFRSASAARKVAALASSSAAIEVAAKRLTSLLLILRMSSRTTAGNPDSAESGGEIARAEARRISWQRSGSDDESG